MLCQAMVISKTNDKNVDEFKEFTVSLGKPSVKQIRLSVKRKVLVYFGVQGQKKLFLSGERKHVGKERLEIKQHLV